MEKNGVIKKIRKTHDNAAEIYVADEANTVITVIVDPIDSKEHVQVDIHSDKQIRINFQVRGPHGS
jgi:DNA-directed RNA polymerase subunit L